MKAEGAESGVLAGATCSASLRLVTRSLALDHHQPKPGYIMHPSLARIRSPSIGREKLETNASRQFPRRSPSLPPIIRHLPHLSPIRLVSPVTAGDVRYTFDVIIHRRLYAQSSNF